ncbi:hypothetical protein TSOC_010065, partial [Tetrabaena socialis]
EVMAQWVAYRFSCSGSAAGLDTVMSKYSAMVGYDVLYFDAHQYFFQHPLQHIYRHHPTANVVVSPTSCQPPVLGPDGSLPDDHHHLDIVFLRSTPSSFRCLFNWLYWSTHTTHDVNDRPLDHHTFRQVMQECVMSLGSAVMSVQYLDPVAFPSECNAKCGCANGGPIEFSPDGTCPK